MNSTAALKMVQTSQIEKPRCSAAIDQMRLRRAMALPLEFQYFSSSGFQSEIQVLFSVLIGNFLSLEVVNPPGAFSLFHRKKPQPEACRDCPRQRRCSFGPSLDLAASPKATDTTLSDNSSFVPI